MCHIALASICIAALAAGDVPAPFIQLAMTDLARTSERVAAGPYGKIWLLPAVQKLRADLTALPGADAAWMTMIGQVREARFDLTLIPGKPGKPEPIPRMAVRLPAGHDPAAPEGVGLRRDGDWLLLGKADALGLPPVVSDGADSDLRLVINAEAIIGTLPPQSVQPVRQILAILGLGKLNASATAFPGGIREQIVLSGSRLPLKAIDPSALAGFPEHPMGISVIGVDGQALVRMVHDIATATGDTQRLEGLDAVFRGTISVGLDDIIRGIDGTTIFAVSNGVPFPGFTLSLPGSKAIDSAVAQLFDPMAAGTGTQMVERARTQSVIVPTPPNLPIAISIRRTATRWLISTDQMLIETLASATAEAFPIERVWPKSAGAVGLLWNDNKAQMQMMAGFLPMMGANMSKDKDAQRLFASAQSALIAALPYLLPSSLVARTQKEGLYIDGENGLVSNVMGMSVLAGMALPAISMVRESAQRASAGNNIHQMLITMMMYKNDNDDIWPMDLAATKKFADGELPDIVFQSPGHSEIAEPFLYVRPVPNAKSIQPVIVQDPACNRGKGSVVGYADGHTQYVQGQHALEIWAEAKRLAALPKATLKEGGITTNDWAVLEPVAQPAPEAPTDGTPKF